MNHPLSSRRVEDANRSTLTPKESTKITRFGVAATYQMLRDGTLPSIRVGKRFFIPRAALERWLDSCGGRDAA